MPLDNLQHYNNDGARAGMSSNPEQHPRTPSSSPHSSQNLSFPVFPFSSTFPAPGFFPGLYPHPDFGFLSTTAPFASQIAAPLPMFPITRPHTPPAATEKGEFAFEPDITRSYATSSPSTRDLREAQPAPRTEEELIKEDMIEAEFQENFVDALRKSGRMETADKVIKARQQLLEERGRVMQARGDAARPGQSPGASSASSTRGDAARPGQSPGASSASSTRGDAARPGQSPGASSASSSADGDTKKNDIPEWFAKAKQEVKRENEEARKKNEHFERQMARFGLGNNRPERSPQRGLVVELPPPYDKLDLERADLPASGSDGKKDEDLYAKCPDDETERKTVVNETKESQKMSALDDILNDVVAKSREMTDMFAEDKNGPLDQSRDSMTSPYDLDSSRDEESFDFDMHMAHVEDAPESQESSSELAQSSYGRGAFYAQIDKREWGDESRHPPPENRAYPTLREDDKSDHVNENRDNGSASRDYERGYKSSNEQEIVNDHIAKPSVQDLNLFRAIGLKCGTEMQDFHRLMALTSRQMADESQDGEARNGALQPFPIPYLEALPLMRAGLSSATSINYPSSVPMPSTSALPNGAENGPPIFPGMGPRLSYTISRGNNRKRDIYICHLCAYTGTTKYHFSAHMSTHFEHRCQHCDYTSRTEGRLKRHIKDFHSEDSNGPSANPQKTMRSNMPGRPKMYRCKQCEFVANTKAIIIVYSYPLEKDAVKLRFKEALLIGKHNAEINSRNERKELKNLIVYNSLSLLDQNGVEFWVHVRVHIKRDKALQCPRCPFVTEYKHHLEYHLRNHFGSKPYKCGKCNYSCVNKSMLNSHMKSHTNVYQYRCADCTYATKYCHSLKLHLRKYHHKPAAILNVDGSLPLEDSKAQNELMRNRDRGPRAVPRSQVYRRSDMDSSIASLPETGMPRLPGMNGAMVPPMYWPVLNSLPPQLPPPPMIPVTNVPITAQADRSLSGLSAGPSNPSSGNDFKCKLCCFITNDKETFNRHMLKVHAPENQDLFSAYDINDSFEDEARRNGNGDESHPRGSPSEGDFGAVDLSKPMDLSKCSDANRIPYNRKKRLLEHCLSSDMDEKIPKQVVTEMAEPAKTDVTAQRRKRSRKGKAFKLDTSSIRLSEDDSTYSAMENEEFNRTDDFAYNSDEVKDEDPPKVTDFKDIHENLRNLKLVYTASQANLVVNEKPIHSSNTVNTNGIDSGKPDQECFKVVVKTEPQTEPQVEPSSPYKPDSPYKMKDSPRQNGGISDNDDSGSVDDASSPENTSHSNGHHIKIKGEFYVCQYCEIAFRDCVLYTSHMGYHDYKDVFHCTNCGYHAKDKVDFFFHIARFAHV